MKSKDAQKLLKGRIKTRDNGETYVAKSVRIKGSDLKNGSVVVFLDTLED